MSNIKKYVPNYYDGVYEFEKLMQVNDEVFDKFTGLLKMSFLNNFVTQANEDGVGIFEDMYNIFPNKNDTLDNRKSNVILKMLPPKPITIKYFQELIELLKIKATVEVDTLNFLVNTFSEVGTINDSQINQLRELLKMYLPANLQFQINTKSETSTTTNLYYASAHSSEVEYFIKTKE